MLLHCQNDLVIDSFIHSHTRKKAAERLQAFVFSTATDSGCDFILSGQLFLLGLV